MREKHSFAAKNVRHLSYATIRVKKRKTKMENKPIEEVVITGNERGCNWLV